MDVGSEVGFGFGSVEFDFNDESNAGEGVLFRPTLGDGVADEVREVNDDVVEGVCKLLPRCT